MQIIIQGLNYSPEPIGIGPYTSGLAEFLVGRGHRVTVIAGNPYYPDWKLAGEFEDRVSMTLENGVTVVRVPHFIPTRPNGIRRIVHYLSFAANARLAMRNVAPADVVIAIAPALLAAPTALGAARRFGALSWLHIQDFEVDAAVATGLLSRGPLAWLAQTFEKRMLSKFDRVSTISAMMVRKAIQKNAPSNDTIELRNWAEPTVHAWEPRNDALLRELNIPVGPVALYSGNLARKQGSEVIVDAARLLVGNSKVQFVVCGAGPARPRLEQAAVKLENLHIRDLQPRERLDDLLAAADMHILPQIAGAADLVLPSKLANMLASGRPIIATAALGTGLAQEVEGCGVVTPPGDAAEFANAIAVLATDENRRKSLGRAAAQRGKDRWSASVLLENFALALEQAVEGQAGV